LPKSSNTSLALPAALVNVTLTPFALGLIKFLTTTFKVATTLGASSQFHHEEMKPVQQIYFLLLSRKSFFFQTGGFIQNTITE
jgi:hypothetical protein